METCFKVIQLKTMIVAMEIVAMVAAVYLKASYVNSVQTKHGYYVGWRPGSQPNGSFSSAHLSIYSSVHLLIYSVHLFIYSSVRLVICQSSSVHLFIYSSSIHLFVCTSVHLFIYSSIHL